MVEQGLKAELEGIASTQAADWLSWLTVSPLVIPLAAAALVFVFQGHGGAAKTLALLATGAVFVSSAILLVQMPSTGPASVVMGQWAHPFGIAFVADSLGLMFVLFSAPVVLCVLIAGSREHSSPGRVRVFYSLVLVTFAGVCGIFLTADIFNMYVWFEVVLCGSFGLLILGRGYWQLQGAFVFGIANILSTTLFLVATGMLYSLYGTLSLPDLTVSSRSSFLVPDSTLQIVRGLYFVALGIKTALIPVHFWLIGSYFAARPAVTAFMASLMTKVGVFALIRILFVSLGGRDEWFSDAVGLVAVITMIMGGTGSISRNGIVQALSYVVVAGVGVSMAPLALSGDYALGASIFYSLQSIIALGGIFLVAGALERMNCPLYLTWAGGMQAHSPLLAAVAAIFFLAVAGLPPMPGFWGKYMIVREAIVQEAYGIAFTILFSSILVLVCLARIWTLAFWRDVPDREGEARFQPVSLSSAQAASVFVPLVALAVGVTLVGLLPEALVSGSMEAATMAMSDYARTLSVRGFYSPDALIP